MIGSFKTLAPNSKWHWAGWHCVLSCFLILGFYGVIAGWSFAYVVKSVAGVFSGLGAVPIKLFGMSFFDFIIFLVEAIFLPIGGLMVVVFIGWRLKRKDIEETLIINGKRPWYLNSYLTLTKYVVPIFILIILIKTLLDSF